MGDTLEEFKAKSILEYLEKIYGYENQTYKDLEDKSYRFLYFLLGLQTLLTYLFTKITEKGASVADDIKISVLFPLILIFIGYYFIYRAISLKTFSRPTLPQEMFKELLTQPNSSEFHKILYDHYYDTIKKNTVQNERKSIELQFCEVILLLVLYSTLVILIFVFLNIDSYLFYPISLCQGLILFGSLFIAVFILFDKTLRGKE